MYAFTEQQQQQKTMKVSFVPCVFRKNFRVKWIDWCCDETYEEQT